MEQQNNVEIKTEAKTYILEKNQKYLLPLSIVIASIILSGTWLYISKTTGYVAGITQTKKALAQVDMEQVAPKNGVTLPVTWGDLGAKMVETGVIDKEKFDQLYAQRGGLSEADKKLVYGTENGKIVITRENSGVILNLLWAFGLGNKNEILDNGPIQDKRYGGAGKFASTGGWTLADGDPMKHFSKHSFVVLTAEQQALVNRVAPTIFRPCCDNPTHFPDCNHGMAMLGLLELMASQGVGEEEMYRVALQVNSYWFPNNYQTIASFLESKGTKWKSVNPKDILGPNFSSGSAYQQIVRELNPGEQKGGVSCGA